MTKQVKSWQRVADHGKVFTAEREVNAMLDVLKPKIDYIVEHTSDVNADEEGY